MPPPLGLRPVLVRRPRMQDDVVRHQLDVTALELHVEEDARLARDRLVDVEELALARADRRIGVARGRAEVVAVVEGAQAPPVEATRDGGNPTGTALPFVATIERHRLV